MRNVKETVPHIAVREKAEKVYRPLVYICSPYSGDVEKNTEIARKFSKFALDAGSIPLAPHLLFPQFMTDERPEERELAMFMDIVLLGKCDELWVLAGKVTQGMAVEIEKAKKRRQPIRYFNQNFEEVSEA